MSLGHSSTRTGEHLGGHFSWGAFLFGGEEHFPLTVCVRSPCQHWENRLLALTSSPFWNIPLLLSNHRNSRTRGGTGHLFFARVFRQGKITGASSNTGPSRGATDLRGDCCRPHTLSSHLGVAEDTALLWHHTWISPTVSESSKEWKIGSAFKATGILSQYFLFFFYFYFF